MAKDPEILAHQEWLGYVQPVGLVVSTPALLAAQAYINKNIIPEHQRFLDQVEPIPVRDGEDTALAVTDLPALVQDVFDWQPDDLVSGDALDALEVVLPEYGETLRPAYAVREIEPDTAQALPWMMLIQTIPNGLDLDKVHETDDHHWQASPHARFERLLRESKIPTGLLCNGTHLRLIYAPRGETSGWLTFPVDAMAQVDGRPIFAGLHLLLSAERLFTLPRKQRLPWLLAESRKYQNEVSTQLSGQVLESLYELLHGFQAADDQSKGELLRQVLREDPNHVYAGLLNVLLRLVFVLYAEDRGLMPGDPVYTNFYSINGLFERLRSDNNRFPDTMDQRYGAWAQLLSLFRLIHDGAGHGAAFQLPPRHGHLFNPDRYPFLEGRPFRSTRQVGATVQPPLVSDGIVFRVLQNLLLLDGERLSYRTLDVEQIGSVYETVMGFALEVARGRSIALKPAKAHGAPVTINLDALLAVKPAQRAKWVKDNADQKITGESLKALQAAQTPEDLVAALGKKVSPTTPRIVPPGAMILQPSDERRRSGSHYTPRSLTEPIVRTTLRPVLEQLGDTPTPEQILALKVCDPAMGSGAFLVEADRQLADELVKAWHHHNCVPVIPPDEDEVLFARRLVVQRCLYGVDKNPMAVDLAKLALWLATLARDHAFTFVDHALRCGDSLVGLTRNQIAAFHWQLDKTVGLFEGIINERLQHALDLRARIQCADESLHETSLRLMLKESQEALEVVRAIGDAVIAAFFSSEKPKDREAKRNEYLAELTHILASPSLRAERSNLDMSQIAASGDRPPRNDEMTSAPGDVYAFEGLVRLRRSAAGGGCNSELPPNLTPFHWEIEFPEVFQRENPGFDAFVGNPPFLGGTSISTANSKSYLVWLMSDYPDSGDRMDLVAYFFRRAYGLLRDAGTFGLIATNTIAQGDTRKGGLRWIIAEGGQIFNSKRRLKWPGDAAVIVTVVHFFKGNYIGERLLDGHQVERITAFLFHRGESDDPLRLRQNQGQAFNGVSIYGMGFTFADEKADATPIRLMQEILASRPSSASVIQPYLGGDEVNDHPTHQHSRFVINLSGLSEAEARARHPELMDIVEKRVKPERLKKASDVAAYPWWRFWRERGDLRDAVCNKNTMLVCARHQPNWGLVFLPTTVVASDALIAFAVSAFPGFSLLQSRPHEIWARFFGSSMKDDLRYTPSDCFETFPFPADFETHPALESTGKEYYEFRAALMVRNNEGLTKTYNRFHDPEERSPDILRLRELHAAMDWAVLDAYGWTDLQPTCEFLLDYEEEEDEDDTPAKGRGRKKPWRYRWPDDFRDEVLARLLELNRQYAEEERLTGAANEKKGKRSSTTKATKTAKKKEKEKEKDDQGDLF